jgi:hypothetical protein
VKQEAPAGPMILRISFTFTEEDGSAASIFDKTEGPDRKKLQYEVKFVDARQETILTETWHMKQQRQQKQDRLAREERLLLNKKPEAL